jgi:hypothetical protein
MAVAHAFGFARDLNLNCPTETSTFVHNHRPSFGTDPLALAMRVAALACSTPSWGRDAPRLA